MSSSLITNMYFFFFFFFAAPLTSPVTKIDIAFIEEEAERLLEERLSTDLCNTDALYTLMEVKIKARKMEKVFRIFDCLIQLEPKE